jgi:hypothetical protein
MTVEDREALEHSASNEFRARGVTPGDLVYVVTVRNGQLYVGASLVVGQLLGQRAAERALRGGLWTHWQARRARANRSRGLRQYNV